MSPSGPDGFALLSLPAWRLAERVRAGDVSAVAVTEAALRRIAAEDPGRINAFSFVDEVGARAAAQSIEDDVRHGRGLDRPLLGVPVAIKDELAVAGLPTTLGSRLCVGTPPPAEDCAAVRRVREAGGVILGKTHMPEFGHKGMTDNRLGPGGAVVTTVSPADPTRTAGGSSGGAAAAVAAGFSPLALGTDIAGSVRIPASCCGIVGLKPTYGMIPRTPSGNSFSPIAVGPLARTAADAALAMRVLAGPDGRDRLALPPVPPESWDVSRGLPAGLRVGWAPSLTGSEVHPGVADACRRALARLEPASATVRDLPSLVSGAPTVRLMGAVRTLFQVLCLGWLKDVAGLPTREAFDAAGHLMTPTFRAFAEPAWSASAAEYLEAEVTATAFAEGPAADYFAGWDVIATPTLAVPPPRTAELIDQVGPERVNGEPVDRLLGWLLTWPFNLTGHPAVSVPCGTVDDPNPVPVGLQLVAPRGADGLLLRVAAALERPAVTPA